MATVPRTLSVLLGWHGNPRTHVRLESKRTVDTSTQEVPERVAGSKYFTLKHRRPILSSAFFKLSVRLTSSLPRTLNASRPGCSLTENIQRPLGCVRSHSALSCLFAALLLQFRPQLTWTAVVPPSFLDPAAGALGGGRWRGRHLHTLGLLWGLLLRGRGVLRQRGAGMRPLQAAVAKQSCLKGRQVLVSA